VSRVTDDQDVPRHWKQAPRRKRWRVQVKWRSTRLWGSGWCWGAKYAAERDARRGFESYATKGFFYSAVRLLNPDGEVVAEQAIPRTPPASETEPDVSIPLPERVEP
jgi:hypothetical protein